MRYVTLLCALCLSGCLEDEIYYADGSTWAPVEERDVALLKNDSLIKHPYLRRMPTNEREWARFIETLNGQPVRNLGDVVQTFTPTWNGFSSDPSGDISYMHLGSLVVMWRATALTGTSDAGAFTITNLPEAITPVSATKVRCVVVDDGLQRGGAAEPDPAGDIDFYIEVPNTADSRIDLAGNSFTASGTKGLPAGWLIMYPLE